MKRLTLLLVCANLLGCATTAIKYVDEENAKSVIRSYSAVQSSMSNTRDYKVNIQLAGRLIDETESPIAGQDVHIYIGDVFIQKATTDSSGVFSGRLHFHSDTPNRMIMLDFGQDIKQLSDLYVQGENVSLLQPLAIEYTISNYSKQIGGQWSRCDKYAVAKDDVLSEYEVLGYESKNYSGLNNTIVLKKESYSADKNRKIREQAIIEAQRRKVAEEAARKIQEAERAKEAMVLARKKANCKAWLLESASTFRKQKSKFDALEYELNNKTLSKDIEKKSMELRNFQYAKLLPAAKDFNSAIGHYRREKGSSALRDIAIQNGFIDLLSNPEGY